MAGKSNIEKQHLTEDEFMELMETPAIHSDIYDRLEIVWPFLRNLVNGKENKPIHQIFVAVLMPDKSKVGTKVYTMTNSDDFGGTIAMLEEMISRLKKKDKAND